MQDKAQPTPNPPPPPGRWRRAARQIHIHRFTEDQLEDIAAQLKITDSERKAWLADSLEYVSGEYAVSRAELDKRPSLKQIKDVLKRLHVNATELQESFENLVTSWNYQWRVQEQAEADTTFTSSAQDSKIPPLTIGRIRLDTAGDWVERIESWSKLALEEVEATPSGKGGGRTLIALPQLTLLLAEIYLQLTGRNPGTSTKKRSLIRTGPFVRFVCTVYQMLDPEGSAKRQELEQTIRDILEDSERSDLGWAYR